MSECKGVKGVCKLSEAEAAMAGGASAPGTPTSALGEESSNGEERSNGDEGSGVDGVPPPVQEAEAAMAGGASDSDGVEEEEEAALASSSPAAAAEDSEPADGVAGSSVAELTDADERAAAARKRCAMEGGQGQGWS